MDLDIKRSLNKKDRLRENKRKKEKIGHYV